MIDVGYENLAVSAEPLDSYDSENENQLVILTEEKGDDSEKLVSSVESLSTTYDCENRSEISSNGGLRDERPWKKVKWQLVEFHSLPDYQRDNEFILCYYRSEWPLKQAILSIFRIHNETLNIWTHLIGFFLFLCLTTYTALKAPEVVNLESLQRLLELLKSTNMHNIYSEFLKCLKLVPNLPNHMPSFDFLTSFSGWQVGDFIAKCMPKKFSHAYQTGDGDLHGVKDDMVNMVVPFLIQPTTRWPFYTFLGGAMFCLLSSSICHLLGCHSERLSYIMLRFDYSGIAALIATSFYPPVYYSFMCKPLLCTLYLGSITVLGIAAIAFSLLPLFQRPKFRSIRASLFFGMGMSGVAPIVHKMILFWNQPEAVQTTGYEVLMGLLYGLGALIYANRIPERWKPGMFDIVGQSHQLFHILVVAGAYTHYHAGLIYLRWRDSKGCIS